MVKLTRENIISEALNLLDEVGLDAVSTRRLATRLNVEQPSLYWHFRKKDDLLCAMAESAMRPHALEPLPAPADDWRSWFTENSRSFRRTLLMHRDGARLHAGLVPNVDLDRIWKKLAFLETSGVPKFDAQMALLTASRFTVGSVLEEQADDVRNANSGKQDDLPNIDHEVAFEVGIGFIVGGLAMRATNKEDRPPDTI